MWEECQSKGTEVPHIINATNKLSFLNAFHLSQFCRSGSMLRKINSGNRTLHASLNYSSVKQSIIFRVLNRLSSAVRRGMWTEEQVRGLRKTSHCWHKRNSVVVCPDVKWETILGAGHTSLCVCVCVCACVCACACACVCVRAWERAAVWVMGKGKKRAHMLTGLISIKH